MRRARRWITVGFIAASGLLLGVAVPWIAASLSAPPRLVIDPPTFEISEPLLQGATAQVSFTVRNEGTSSVTIRRMPLSCGCMTVKNQRGETLALPFTLDSGEQRALTVVISGSGAVGRRLFNVSVESDEGAACESTIKGYVVSPLVADPDVVVWEDVAPGEAVETSVTLSDMLEDEGMKIADIRVSRPDVVSAELEQTTGASEAFGENPGSKRYRLHLAYRSNSNQGAFEYVTLLPADPSFTPVVIPIHVRARRPSIELSPATLAMERPAENEVVRRRISLQTGASAPQLRIRNCPPWVTASIESDGGLVWLKLRISAPPENETGGEVEVVDGGNQKATLPIRLYDPLLAKTESPTE